MCGKGYFFIRREGKGWVIKLEHIHKNAVRWKHGGTYVSSVHSLHVCVQYVHRGGSTIHSRIKAQLSPGLGPVG